MCECVVGSAKILSEPSIWLAARKMEHWSNLNLNQAYRLQTPANRFDLHLLEQQGFTTAGIILILLCQCTKRIILSYVFENNVLIQVQACVVIVIVIQDKVFCY